MELNGQENNLPLLPEHASVIASAPISPPLPEQKKSKKNIFLFSGLLVLLLFVGIGTGIFLAFTDAKKTDAVSIKSYEIPVEPTIPKQQSHFSTTIVDSTATNIPATKKILIKSQTESYLDYKFYVYDISSNQINAISLPADFSMKEGVTVDGKQLFTATEKEIRVSNTQNLEDSKVIFSLPEQPRVDTSERINDLDTAWSSNGDKLAFTTESYVDFEKNPDEIERKYYVINDDGTNQTLVKKTTTTDSNYIQAFDAVKNELYDSIFNFKTNEENYSHDQKTEVIDITNGSTKRIFSAIDSVNIKDDPKFSAGLKYVYLLKETDQKNFQMIQHDIASGTEKKLYEFSKNGGQFLLSQRSDACILVKYDERQNYEVSILNFQTGTEEKLYDTSEYAFVPTSVSPDFSYLWTEDTSNPGKTLYKLFELKTKKWITIPSTEELKIKLAPLGNVYWLP